MLRAKLLLSAVSRYPVAGARAITPRCPRPAVPGVYACRSLDGNAGRRSARGHDLFVMVQDQPAHAARSGQIRTACAVLTSQAGRRPAHPDADASRGFADLDVISQAGDQRETQPVLKARRAARLRYRGGDAVSSDGAIAAGTAGIGHLDLEPAGRIGQRDPDSVK